MALVAGGGSRRDDTPFYGAGALISPRNPAFNREANAGNPDILGLQDIIMTIEDLAKGGGGGPELKSPRFRPSRRRNRGVIRGAARGGPTGPLFSPPGGRSPQYVSNSLDKLFNQLTNTLGQDAPSFDYDRILKASIRDINDAYAAEAGAIRGNKRSARNRARATRRELEDMYNALSGSYNQAANQERRSGKQFARQQGKIFNQQERATKRNNRNLMQDQVEMMKQLGIEDAAPDVIPQQTKMAAEQLGDIAAQRGYAKNRARNLSKINRNYLVQGGQTAKLEGTNRSADVMDDLEMYLQAQNENLADVKSRRKMSIADMRTALQSQLAEQQQDYQTNLWEQLMGLAQFRLDIDSQRSDAALSRLGITEDRNDSLRDYQLKLQQMAIDRAEAASGDDSGSELDYGGLSQVSEVLSGAGRKNGSKLMNIFDSVLRTPQMRQGRFQDASGNTIQMTPEELAYRLEQIGRQQGLRPHEIRLLRLAAFQYMG